MNRRFLWSLASALLTPAVVFGQTIPAFPGADGAARNVTGGRGGIVYHVTKLDQNYSDTAPGTLRYGLTDSNFPAGTRRIIVFDVAGTFWLGRFGEDRGHDNGWDTQSRLNIGSNVTIAGQTAPGPVYIMGGVVKAGANNAIIRNVTIAPGYGMRNFEKPDEDPPELPFPGDGSNPRNFPDSYVYDAIDITSTNIMIDHVSTFYATDETISANEQANNVTIQYSNISQGQNYPQADAEASGTTYTGHALGSLLQAGTNAAISVHHNLYAHQKGRLPRVGSEVGTGAYNDFRNNVFYNWFGTAGQGGGGQPSYNNFVGNFYLAGAGGDDPVGGSSTALTNRSGGTGIFSGNSVTRVYHSGNLRDINKDGDPNDGQAVTNSHFGSSNFQASPVWSPVAGVTYHGVTDSATEAFTRVLKYMGANWWMRDYDFTLGNVEAIDTVDERLIHETYTVTGKIKAWADDPFNDFPGPPPFYDPYDPNEGAEWRQLLSYRANPSTGAAPFTRDANWDTDGDGMPDHWEVEHGLNPTLAEHNGDFDNDGYTNVEEYINDLAAWPAPSAIAFNNANGDGRYAHILNWDANPDPAFVHPWQPSRFDTAVIDNGVVVVDAVGQHAGNLLLGTQSGDNATLNITSGWLKVSDEAHGLSDGATVIADHPSATATLNLSGGKLVTKTLLKGAGGTFNFTGGVLSAETVGFTLENHGGTIAPGASAGMTHVMGDLVLNSGVLEIEIGGTDPGQYDLVIADGVTTLGGTLRVTLIDPAGGESPYAPALDDSFAFLMSEGGFAAATQFAELDLPDLSEGLDWALTSNDMALVLTVVEASAGLPGDYNNDGRVDAGDYVRWRNHLGDADESNISFNGDGGDIGLSDYTWWKSHYGDPPPEGAGGLAGVPEPASAVTLLVGVAALAWRRRVRLGH